MAEGSGLFVIGLDAEGRPAQASNLAFMRIGRPALELADDVVRHRTLSCLLFAPYVAAAAAVVVMGLAAPLR